MDEDALVTSEKLRNGLFRLISTSSEYMYLVEGRERTALIDTGTGLGNLLDALDKVTEKPVVPLLSHGHSDHSGGASWFDILDNSADPYAMPALGETIVLAKRRRSREDRCRGNVIYDSARDPRR